MNPATLQAGETTDYRNYHRLFMLRNAEIACIGLGIAVAVLYFELALPLRALLLILFLIISLNTYTWFRLRTGNSFSSREIFTSMLLDVAGLTAVFFHTGGASNPFVWFYLLPLMIAATILPRLHTWVMAAVSVACYSALFFVKAPELSMHLHHHSDGFQMHVLGMWLGFVMSAGFVAVIIVGMASSLRERDQRLAEAREQTLRNERLVALGTLAAGTAHELGTPLGTMTILIGELQQEFDKPEFGDLGKRLALLSRQLGRCKQALSSLSTAAGAERAESGHLMDIHSWIQALADEWREQRPGIGLQLSVASGPASSMVLAERTLTQALVNILNNAADASPDDVTLTAGWDERELKLEIGDRGPGLSTDVHDRLGKYPVTTKPEGLGVGLYLAHATIERLGGRIAIRDRSGGGTLLTIMLPLLARAR